MRVSWKEFVEIAKHFNEMKSIENHAERLEKRLEKFALKDIDEAFCDFSQSERIKAKSALHRAGLLD